LRFTKFVAEDSGHSTSTTPHSSCQPRTEPFLPTAAVADPASTSRYSAKVGSRCVPQRATAPLLPEETATAKKLHGAGLQLARIELQPGGLPSGFACPGSSYVGVGVTADPRTERIILVGDDTPASRAGLQHDDIVLNPAVWRGTHQEGVVLWVQVLREGATMVVPVRVGKICIG